jgi:UDP-glucose 4-epimerase
MRVLVTGGAGFIGSHVADRLHADGHEVLVVDNLSTGRRQNLASDIELRVLDIREPALDACLADFRPELVIHLAAQVNARRSTTEPLLDAEINILGSLRLLESARVHGVRKVVYASTAAVYGEPRANPVPEDHHIAPICPYGASKQVVEQYLHSFAHNHGIDFTVLRFPNIYGPRQDAKGEAGVVAIFCEQMIRNEDCVIFGDGGQTRDFLYVGDAARACAMLVGTKGAKAIYNLGTAQMTSVLELHALLKEMTGVSQDAMHQEAKPGEIYSIALDASRIQREIGWKAEVSIGEGLSETVEFMRDSILSPVN